MRRKFTPVTHAVEQERLEWDYAQAERFGQVRVGESFVFHAGALQIRYLPLDEIVWVYLRREEALASVGCRRVAVPDYYVMLVTGAGTVSKLGVAERVDADRLVERIAGRNPSAVTGYSEQNAARFSR